MTVVDLKTNLEKRDKLIQQHSHEQANYFNIKNYLDLEKYSTYIFITMRNIGKTTSVFQLIQEVYELTGEFTVFMRSSQTELENFKKDFAVNPPRGWNKGKYKVEGNRVVEIETGNMVILFVSLSTARNFTSISGENCFGIVYDEFLHREGGRDVNPKALIDFIKTIERDKMATVILLANATTLKSSILNHFSIFTDKNEVDLPHKRLRYRRIIDWKLPPNIKQISTSEMWAQGDEDLMNYMYSAEFLDGEDDSVIPEDRLGRIVWTSALLIFGEIVSIGFNEKRNFIAALGLKNKNLTIKKIFTEDLTHHMSNAYKMYRPSQELKPIFNAMVSGNIYYTTYQCKDVMLEMILKYNGVKQKEV